MSLPKTTMNREGAAEARGRFGNLLLMAAIAGIVIAVFGALQAGINPWNAFFINPIINILILLNNILFHDFGVAIIVFTLVMRLVTIPLTLRQLRSTRAMSAIQPRLQEIQKKYKDPKRRQEETMKLYREAGVNPLGCLVPMLVQFPIWIALYRALIIMVGGTPERLVDLSQRVYPWLYLSQAVPLENRFLWLDLGQPDGSLILPLLVGVSTYVQQKLTTPAGAATQQQQQMTSMMNWMMPLMFFWITLAVPSGLGVYWVVSNITSVFLSYYVYGRRGISWRQVLLPAPSAPAARLPGQGGKRPAPRQTPAGPQPEESVQAAASARPEARSDHGRRRRRRGKRKDRR